MAITPSLLTEGSAAAATSHATASVTPAANKLILLAVTSGATPATTVPTATGCSLTWVQVATQQQGASNQRVTVLRALGAAPTTGAITIDFAGVANNCAWKVIEFDGANISGTNGSGAIVQSNSANGGSSPLTVTLGAGVTAGNITFGIGAANSSSVTLTAGTDFTFIGNRPALTTPSSTTGVEWSSIGANPVAITTSGSPNWAIIGIELKAATTQTGSADLTGTGTLAATALRTALAAAALSGSGSLSATLIGFGWQRWVPPPISGWSPDVPASGGWSVRPVPPISGWS